MPVTKVHIEEPCSVKWNSMQPHEDGKFCGACQTPVIDFTQYSIEEIRQYFQANSQQHVCGRYHARHTADASPWLNTVQRLESGLRRSGLKKVSIMVVAALLLFSQCARKRIQGRMKFHTDDPKKLSYLTKPKKHGL